MNEASHTVTLQAHQRNIIAWANTVFPERMPKDVLLKLNEEIGELIKNPIDPHEYADVMILLLDFAAFNGIDGNRLSVAIAEKMEINKRRSWCVDQNTGIMQHT